MHTDDKTVAALRKILGSLYPDGDHLLSSFLYSLPGSMWERQMVAEIFAREPQYMQAVLFVREHGASYLKDISLGSLRSMVTKFVTTNYAYIIGGNRFSSPGVSLADQVSEQGLATLSKALGQSALFRAKSDVTIYPLFTVEVRDPFKGRNFSFDGPASLASSLEGFGLRWPSLMPHQFPPFAEVEGSHVPTRNWLCVRAPDPLIARKRSCAILGALALTPIWRERYIKTGRSVRGGQCTISTENFTYSYDAQPSTPPIGHDVLLTQHDHPWLQELDTLIYSTEVAKKSHMRALEYFYRAWFDDPRERFPTLCMALDSLVAAQREHTKAAIKFVSCAINGPIDQERLRHLLKLRGAVVHGAAPDVYESAYYESYYAAYGVDPIRDLELVVARCLRQSVFQGKLTAHADPHAEKIKQLQETGRLPRNLSSGSIIDDE